ncbi:MAG: hypothetical protein WCI73_14180 [Phycisphaerae bacterium]
MLLERITYDPPLPGLSPEEMAALIPAAEMARLLGLNAVKEASQVAALQSMIGRALTLLEEQYGIVAIAAEFRWTVDATDAVQCIGGRFNLALPVAPVAAITALTIKGQTANPWTLRNGLLFMPSGFPAVIEFAAGWTRGGGIWNSPLVIRLAVAKICLFLRANPEAVAVSENLVGSLIAGFRPAPAHAGIIGIGPPMGGN